VPRSATVHGRLLAAIVLAAGCGAAPAPAGAPSTAAPLSPGPSVVHSNVLRADYAGSRACAACHSDIYARWEASPMRRMTRLASPSMGAPPGSPGAGPIPPEAAIQAPFDGSVFRFKGDAVTMEEHGGRKYMRLASQKAGAALYRVTKVIGGRYREDFAGYEVSGTEAESAPIGNPHLESVLPVSYLIFAKTWRYKGYSVMVKERPWIEKGGAAWQKTCIFCHNTPPALASMYDELLGGAGKPYQGSVSDRFLPPDRLWKPRITDAAGLSLALGEEIAFLRGEPAKSAADAGPAPSEGRATELLGEAIKVTRARFGQRQLIEVGIGCEACHNGSKEHVEDPSRRPSFAIQSPLLEMTTPDPRRQGRPAGRAEWINRTCARCHTVLFSRYPFTWEGGQRDEAPGGSSINSGEARDYLLGGCSAEMSCAACHDPHTEDSREDLDALGTTAGNRVCLGCHAKYKGREALGAHSHHAPEGEGSACLSCHMPKKNTGLTYRLTRYHRIGSPTDKARVEKDRPLECALCHADRSVASLLETMERWWGRRYDRGALRSLYGADLSVNPLLRTVTDGKPHEQITAAAVLGERGPRGASAAAALVPLLSHGYPLVRSWALAAIERVLGKPLRVDLDGDAAQIDAAGRALLRENEAPGRSGAAPR
jgi:predicted CXXCH cytochrome family protein